MFSLEVLSSASQNGGANVHDVRQLTRSQRLVTGGPAELAVLAISGRSPRTALRQSGKGEYEKWTAHGAAVI